MSFPFFNDNGEQTQKPLTAEDAVDPIELDDSRESVLAKDILIAAIGEAAAKQENGEDIAPGEDFSITITEEIAEPGEVIDLGASALRAAMAMHRQSHDPFLIDVDSDEDGESATFLFL
jgi:hypothetical protein